MAKVISKEEFCKKIRTKEDCWLFDTMNKKTAFFLELNDNTWIYCDGIHKMYEFKDMKEYHEIWVSSTRFDIYSTWSQYED